MTSLLLKIPGCHSDKHHTITASAHQTARYSKNMRVNIKLEYVRARCLRYAGSELLFCSLVMSAIDLASRGTLGGLVVRHLLLSGGSGFESHQSSASLWIFFPKESGKVLALSVQGLSHILFKSIQHWCGNKKEINKQRQSRTD